MNEVEDETEVENKTEVEMDPASAIPEEEAAASPDVAGDSDGAVGGEPEAVADEDLVDAMFEEDSNIEIDAVFSTATEDEGSPEPLEEVEGEESAKPWAEISLEVETGERAPASSPFRPGIGVETGFSGSESGADGATGRGAPDDEQKVVLQKLEDEPAQEQGVELESEEADDEPEGELEDLALAQEPSRTENEGIEGDRSGSSQLVAVDRAEPGAGTDADADADADAEGDADTDTGAESEEVVPVGPTEPTTSARAVERKGSRSNRMVKSILATLAVALVFGGGALAIREFRQTSERLGAELASRNTDLMQLSERIASLEAARAVMEEQSAEQGASEAAPSDGGPGGQREHLEVAEAGLAAVEERLNFLEKRARLTSYADEAISSGSRYAFNQLEKEFENPGLIGLKVASNSEIIRVESVYARTAGMRYHEIPVGLIDDSLSRDTELSVAQLGEIILSNAVPAEARARAAELLGKHTDPDSCELLVECIRTEPNLSVLIEATRSFKRVTGYPGGRVFGGEELEDWYRDNKKRISADLLLRLESGTAEQ
ncbi:MAG: hypothetical protein ACC661_04130 [Verrucomicrobiales bacterium]